MSALACCFWWFVFGVLVGWLLNWLLSKMMRKDPPVSGSSDRGSGAGPGPAAYTPPRVATPAPTPAPIPGGTVNLEAARSAGFSLRNANDLAVIDGIGPKIAELFHEHGITTFAQVAKMSVPQMQAILDAGGPHFKLANPATWAHQAQLILDNRWGDLRTLHDQLAAIVKNETPHN
jgi:predicted flap endonuclease-1-like 5' DNA nuclease